MNRPLKESGKGRNVSVNIRLTQEEKELIDTLAGARGMEKTALLITLVKEDAERRKELVNKYQESEAELEALRKQ